MLFYFYVGVIARAAGEALEGADGIFEVGNFLGFCGLPEVSGLGSETDERAAGC